MNIMAITQTPMIATNTKNHHQSEEPACTDRSGGNSLGAVSDGTSPEASPDPGSG